MKMKYLVISFLLCVYAPRDLASLWLTSPLDPHRCDRPDDIRVIYICNPDKVLEEKDVRNLESSIQKIKNTTKSDCSQEGAPPRGYTIRITILNKYNESLHPMPRDYHEKRTQRMHEFARFQHDNLTPDSDPCDDGITFLISVKDKTILSIVGDEARSVLKSEKQRAIDTDAEYYLAHGDVRDALQFLLNQYGAVLRGDSGSVLVESDKTAIIAAVVAVVLIITLLILAIIVFRWLRGLKPNECVDAAATNTTTEEPASQTEQSSCGQVPQQTKGTETVRYSNLYESVPSSETECETELSKL